MNRLLALPDSCYLAGQRQVVAMIGRGGYVFIAWKGDHSPRHVHVYRDGRLVSMKGKATQRVLRLIKELDSEGLL